ncbi:MAG: hypothetical protein IKK34_12940 [Clostridia bacterium]|nr:hypothetical protein [Clostridia bacterium]
MKRRRQVIGDSRMSEEKGAAQPLSMVEQELLGRGYALFEHFREQLADEHAEMLEARQMRALQQREKSSTSPAMTTLGSCVDNVVADQIDNMPEAQLIPEREETRESARDMTDVLSFVLHRARWESRYQTIIEDAVVTGTGVAQVFWDDEAEDGEGMAGVLAWHPEDFYPDPLYENIQDGRACFKTTHTTVGYIEERYPHVRGFVTGDSYAYMDGAETWEAPGGDARVTLIEFWYKRYDAQARRAYVHMAQMAGGALLCSTETGYGLGGEEYEGGVYAHGEYPFVLYRYRDVWRRPFGSGLIHDYRETQNAIDRYCKYIDDNARESSVQRHFIRRGSGVNADDVADMRRTVIEWDGSDIREVLQTIQTQPLNSQVYQMMQYMADAMKQDCGQNQFARGEGGLNVTAGTAINALQQAGSKIARWHTERFKQAYAQMVMQILWVLHEYMEPGRTVRIVGRSGAAEDRMVALGRAQENGAHGIPKPAYTVRVQIQRHNPDQIARDNEFLLQAAKICAEAGTPLPAKEIIRLMEGQRIKESVLAAMENGESANDEAETENDGAGRKNGRWPLAET